MVQALCLSSPMVFFYGASTNNSGGVGFCLFLNESHSYEFSMGVCTCTNTNAELLALWALLHVAQLMWIPTLNIFCDSVVIINWAKGNVALNPPDLSSWCMYTRCLSTCFLHLSFSHTYREHNQLADRLSKSALSLAHGCGKYSEFLDGLLASHDTFRSFELGAGACSPFIFAPLWMIMERALLIATLCSCVHGLLWLIGTDFYSSLTRFMFSIDAYCDLLHGQPLCV